jgi:hypothetical protein
MIDVEKAIIAMASNAVDVVLIGGVALNLHSSAYVTYDIDFCYSRKRENLDRLASALRPFKPRLRNFPPELPFILDAGTLVNGTVFTLETLIGDIDLLAEVPGIGDFDNVLAESEEFELFGHSLNVLSIEGLLKAKTAAGREKDIPGIRQLEALLEAESENDD